MTSGDDTHDVVTSNIVPLVVPCALAIVVVGLLWLDKASELTERGPPLPPSLPYEPVSATGLPPPMEGTDMDVDAELMQKFSCMGTTDKDVLISEFQRLLGFQLNPAGCAFFLDMTNW